MDFAILARPEVIIVAVLLALIGAVAGLAIGKTLQARRGDEALDATQKAHARALSDAEANMAKLREEQVQEFRRLQGDHARALDSARERHAGEIKRVHDENAALVAHLNEANNANLNQLREESETRIATLHERQENEMHAVRERMEAGLKLFREENIRATDTLRAEQQASLDSLRAEHAESIATLKREHETLLASKAEEFGRQIEALRSAKDDEIRRLIEHDADLEAAHARLQIENRALQDTMRELNDGIVEAKRNNAFSLSRSGDRLIRVIRSVQELAAELEETSRAVTDGDYSFIGAIKDQRDRETVLRLAGGGSETEGEREARAAEVDAPGKREAVAEPHTGAASGSGDAPPGDPEPEAAEQPGAEADSAASARPS